MKQSFYHLLACLFLVVGLAGCSSDDDNGLLAPTAVRIDTGEREKIVLGETVELKAVMGTETVVDYAWTVNGEQRSTAATFLFTPTEAGIYEIGLTVSNELGSASAKKNIEAVTLDVSIDTGGKALALNPGENLTLKAVTSEAEGLTYSWTVNGAQQSTESTFTFTSQEEGAYQVDLKVANAAGTINETVSITVQVSTYVRSFSHIRYWVGEGENQAALAVQWIDGSNWSSPLENNVHFLCWGYRWEADDSGATGYRMITDIAKADKRFFVMFGPGFGGIGSGTAIYGFGYDGNGDGKFSIKNESTGVTYTQDDFIDGAVTLTQEETSSGSNVPDGFAAMDSGDFWISGWQENYASYYVADNSDKPEGFAYSMVMADLRQLGNNSWDAWTFSSINYENPVNVEPYAEWMKAAVAAE